MIFKFEFRYMYNQKLQDRYNYIKCDLYVFGVNTFLSSNSNI